MDGNKVHLLHTDQFDMQDEAFHYETVTYRRTSII